MPSQDTQPAGGPARSGPPPALIRWLVIAGVALLVALGLYWAGLAHGRSQMAQQKSNYEAQLKSARDQTQAAQAQAAALQTQNRVMSARGLLYRAAVALDNRNFGTANDDIQKAQQALAPVQPGDPGVDAGRLNAFRKTLGATRIDVATDTGAAHAQIVDLAAQADGIVPLP